jgi:histidyl-tRNA synthetase
MAFSRPKGTRDFLPEAMERRRSVEGRMRKVLEDRGYREVQTPTFETLDLIIAKSGEEIRGRLYDFVDKGGRELALRPELTAPVMRLYINELQFQPKPLKLYYVGNCFRYEEPQSGRYREFWQVGVEVIGSPYPEAEAEVISLAWEVLRELGLKDYELHIGNIGLLRAILEEGGVSEADQNRVMNAIDKGEEGEWERLLGELGVSPEGKGLLRSLLKLKGRRGEVLEEAKALLTDHVNEKIQGCMERFEEVLDYLEDFGIPPEAYQVNLGIARGLDYYTGVVFEIYAPRLGAQKQICGGGSYSLTEVLGAPPTPTCGFAFGFDRVLLALEAEGTLPSPRRGAALFVVPVEEGLLGESIRIARRAGVEIPTQTDLMRRKLRKAMAFADGCQIPLVAIVGSEELSRGNVLLRDMRSGRQEEVERGALGKKARQWLEKGEA